MFRESIIPIIMDSYEKFTSLEKTIADFFIENKSKTDFSLKSMKEKLFVSDASLTRFAQKCGFRGYREFIYAYEKEFINITNELSSGAEQVINTYNILLHQITKFVDEDQIDRICEFITMSKKVQAIGIGSSGFSAQEMKSRFMRLGVLIDSEDKDDDIRMSSVFHSVDSLVIGISLSGTKDSILYSLNNAHKNGAKTILITSNADENSSFIDEKILVPTINDLDSGGIISPQFPILIIIDIIYNHFLSSEKYKLMRKKLHEETVKIVKPK